ncbi:MAG: glycine cleavage system aminomethyltransferase GcvT [Anaerolineae bacterium]
MKERGDFLIRNDISEVDPDVDLIIGFEEERQARRLILIPSESFCSLPVRQALGSVFTNVYAEGYPPPRMTRDDEELLVDFDHQLAYYRRYGDRRFYKGCDYVHFVEALARRRCAQCFATDEIGPDQIYANVQPLSGAAANNAVYDAFVKPGDTVMGMALAHGGHLTHGSEYNRSGKNYKIVSYEVDRNTELLDYDEIMRLAVEQRPRMIIAGYTSYPWAPDWAKFREIADAVPGECILLADIAHPAGMVIAGVYPTPVGYADVITFTTHKTVCGPRGAVIMTTDEEKARLLDNAVFPGEQGGPHVNKFAAIAVAFKLAQEEEFKHLQEMIVKNAVALAEGLEKQGLRLAYGGTNTHLLVIDLNAIETDTGFPIKGEIAARILELCGLVTNKNTIPGDESAADASGIRLGTPWVTQRGLGPREMDKLAEIIHRVLVSIKPFEYTGLTGDLPRGKLDLEILEEMKREVADLADSAGAERDTRWDGYPHYFWVPGDSSVKASRLLEEHRRLGAELVEARGWKMPLHYQGQEEELELARRSAVVLDLSDMGVLGISGQRARPFLQEVSTNNVAELSPGRGQRSFLLDKDGGLIDDLLIFRLDGDARGGERYLMLTNPANSEKVKAWLRGLSDGYVLFDNEDVFRKVQGPAVVEDLGEIPDTASHRVALALHGPESADVLSRAGWPGTDLEDGHFWQGDINGIEALVHRHGHTEEDLRYEVVLHPDRAAEVWNLLLEAGAKPAGLAAREALRAEAGLPSYQDGGGRPDGVSLFKAGHAPLFHLSKPYFVGERSMHSVRPKALKEEFTWQEEEGKLRRTPLYEEHRKLTKKIVPFAGWEMPLWYGTVLEEHRSVRQAAGLFDVAHMGVLEVSGEHAASFLDVVTTNYVRWLEDGQAQYSYLLDPDGKVIDDIMVYRRSPDRYMVVVNAANAEKDLAWFQALNSRRYLIDREHPDKEIEGQVTIRDLKDPSSGTDQRVDMALQGPNSLAILQRLTDDPRLEDRLARIVRTEFIETRLAGIDVLVSRTGYTGEDIAYELYLHPRDAPKIWHLLLDRGKDLGVKPAGLGARDSTRTEAGLPLYGRELAGEYDVTPTGAGFAPYVKLHKPYFIGRQAHLDREVRRTMEIIRFRMRAKGIRAIRHGDAVVVRRGEYAGAVTSCALDVDGYQLGMAYVSRRYTQEGTELRIFPLPSGEKALPEKDKRQLVVGDKVLVGEEAVVLSRFPMEE